ncbi:MAG: 30S ribosomal protein S9 [Candidatus Omnitrophota bacterium]
MEEKAQSSASVTAPAAEFKKLKASADKVMATGRRKESTARVQLFKGTGIIQINKRDDSEFFGRPTLRMIIRQPIETAQLTGKIDIIANVCGGGFSGQAGAVRHGISRALVKFDPSLRPILRKEDFLTRDPRMKERKKYGRKGARRRFQFSKR